MLVADGTMFNDGYIGTQQSSTGADNVPLQTHVIKTTDTTTTASEPVKESWFTTGRVIGLVLIVAVIGGFAWWYFKK